MFKYNIDVIEAMISKEVKRRVSRLRSDIEKDLEGITRDKYVYNEKGDLTQRLNLRDDIDKLKSVVAELCDYVYSMGEKTTEDE